MNHPQLPPDSGGICMGVDYRNHLFAPGLPPGRFPALEAMGSCWAAERTRNPNPETLIMERVEQVSSSSLLLSSLELSDTQVYEP